MKQKRNILFLITLTILLPILSGCGVLMTGIRGEKAIADMYFTYINHDDPFRTGQDAGIVIGKITMECGPYRTGSSFTIRDEAGNIVPVKLEYNEQKQYGVIKWKKEREKSVNYIYAGDWNTTSDDDYKEFIGVGALGVGVLMGSLGSKNKNAMNMTMAMPEGWFMVKLPPGKYSISDARADYFENKTSSGYQRTTTVVTEYKNQLNKTINFSIGKEQITYVGGYHVKADGSADFAYDDGEMETALKKGLSRLKVSSPRWAVVK